jgi:hypothetical protein
MQKERECDKNKKSTPWIPGLTPKEHIDMYLAQDNRWFHAKVTLVVAIITIIGTLAATIVGAYIGRKRSQI